MELVLFHNAGWNCRRRLSLSYTNLLILSLLFEPGTVEFLMIKACGVSELSSI